VKSIMRPLLVSRMALNSAGLTGVGFVFEVVGDEGEQGEGLDKALVLGRRIPRSSFGGRAGDACRGDFGVTAFQGLAEASPKVLAGCVPTP